ncbi:hypothetical protein A6A08_15410 [Nocardiopsis sp. TSRI0078]|uniref:DUF202 domain-containing protein n=1 Tax=unclassified Nocardiopsis TaxID=2649073 RepID=UPI00093DB195|nr:DUF202 domain-containing protein [Nocardiopsis sp. TSRI0078]OKI13664.1 hypothetical protein A6A08_15410 [Nocardiopsis sp. TSRI0078]
MISPVERDDLGLQPERTLLAWQRTIALMVVVGLLFLRGSLVPSSSDVPEAPMVVRVAMMAVLLALGLVLGVHLWLRWRASEHGTRVPETGRPPMCLARPWAMAVLCVGVLVLSGVLVLTVLLGL